MLTVTIFIIIEGLFITLGSVLTPFFEGIFTASQISLIGGLFVISGVFGCFFMGLFLDKTMNFLLGVRLVSFSVTVIMIIGFICLHSGVLIWVCLLVFFLGFAVIPVLPSGFGLVAIQAPTVSPAVVNGLMISGAQLYAFFMTLLVDYVLGKGQLLGFGVMFLTCLVAAICTCFLKKTP